MQLKIRYNNIIWDLLLMLVLVSFFDPTFIFVLSFIYLLYLLYKRGFKVSWPEIPGLKLYIGIIILNIFVGIIFDQDFRSILRDIYYFFSTIIWLFISANLYKKEKFDHESFIKTIYLSCIIITIVAFIKFFFNGDLSFNGLRQNMVSGVYYIGFIWILMIYYILVRNRYFFTKRKDILIFTMCSLQIFLSLGRISMGLPILGALITVWLNFVEKNNIKALRKMLLTVGLIIGIGLFAYFVIPKDVSLFFLEKLLNSAQEINSNQVINSTESAMNNWRGYENKVALNQFSNTNIFAQLVGSGLGKGVYVEYVPYSWVGMLENRTLPLLHNGYYTALIKIGLIGTICMLGMFVLPLFKSCISFKRDKYTPLMEIDIFTITISIMSIFFTYVVRGPIQQGVFLGWAILIGYLPRYRDYLTSLQI